MNKAKSTQDTGDKDKEPNEGKTQIEMCKKCSGLIDEEETTKAIMCDGTCKSWYHAECVELTEGEYQILSNTNSNINWYCTGCSDKVEEMITGTGHQEIITDETLEWRNKTEGTISQLRIEVDDLTEQRITKIEEWITNMEGNEIKAMKKRLAEIEKELKGSRDAPKKCTAEDVKGIVSKATQGIIDKVEGLDTTELAALPDIKNMDDRMKKLEKDLLDKKSIKVLEEQMAKIEQKNEQKCSSEEVHGIITHELKKGQQTVQSTVRKAVVEEVSRARERNIVIYRAEEGKSHLKDENIQHDKELIGKLMKQWGVR